MVSIQYSHRKAEKISFRCTFILCEWTFTPQQDTTQELESLRLIRPQCGSLKFPGATSECDNSREIDTIGVQWRCDMECAEHFMLQWSETRTVSVWSDYTNWRSWKILSGVLTIWSCLGLGEETVWLLLTSWYLRDILNCKVSMHRVGKFQSQNLKAVMENGVAKVLNEEINFW